MKREDGRTRTLEWDPPSTVAQARSQLLHRQLSSSPDGEWDGYRDRTSDTCADTTRYRAPLIHTVLRRSVESDYGDGGLGVHFYSETVLSLSVQ